MTPDKENTSSNPSGNTPQIGDSLSSKYEKKAQAPSQGQPSAFRKALLWGPGVLAGLLSSLRSRIGEQGFIFVIAVAIGVVTGICSALLKLMIGTMADVMTGDWRAPFLPWILLAIPVAGIVLTGLYQRYILKMPIDHGVRRITQSLQEGVYKLPSKLMYAWMVASTFTLGFGGSAGSEGPIASTGGAVGSNVARWAGLPPPAVRVLIGCGCGAGIAGIFKAPIGGVLFTLEVLRMEMNTLTVMALISSCLVSAMTAYVLSGFTVDLSYLQPAPFHPSMLLWIVALGVVCGLYSVYYSHIMKTMQTVYGRIRRPLTRNLVSGGVLSLLLFGFPCMYGEGYGVMTDLLNGDTSVVARGSLLMSLSKEWWMPLVVASAIVAVKAFACSATNCGGGVAGDFAPTLFAGCLLGFVFSTFMNQVCGTDIPVSGFAFMGMAGVMAGVCRAPFMAIFLCVEMCNGFVMLLPILITAAVAFGVVRIFEPAAPYRTH